MPGDQQSTHPTIDLNHRLDVDFALQAAGLGIWELDPATRLVKWDNRCRELFGMAKGNPLTYEEAINFIHPDDVDRVDQAVQQAMSPQSGGHYDVTFRTIGADDGLLRWVRFMGKSYFHPGGQVYRFAGVAQEVTPQVQAQQALQQLQARQTYLLALSDRLRWLTDSVQIQYEAACVLGQFLGANRVGYAQTQADTQLVAVTRNYTQGVPGIEGTYRYEDYGPDLLLRLQKGESVVRPDIANDPKLTDDEKRAHAILQLGATLNVPLVKDGQLVAILFVHYQQAHVFSSDQIELVQETAERMWAAVQRARAEEALRESEQQFRLLADALPQAIWETDTEGNVTFLNKWWSDYSGIPFEPITAWQVANDSLHPDDGPLLVAAFRAAMEQETGFVIEQRNRSASGEYRWFVNIGEPYRDPRTKQITKWVGISVDIHDRKRAEQALQESEARLRALSAQLEQQVEARTQELASANENLKIINEELTESNALLFRSNENLQRFAYVASHDLQEPLRKIQQFGDLLKTRYTGSTAEAADYLERMQLAARRMSTLVRDLLSFSRISAQRTMNESVSLEQIVQVALEDLDLVIEETNAQVRVHSLPVVSGDALQLGQLFGNLLGNALKFRQQGIAPVVELKASQLAADHLPEGIKPGRKVPMYHLIEVIDNGIGFDEKYLDRMFEVFQRLHGRSEYSGTGIGLAICQKVVVNYGGAITASSQPGLGAAFSIYLPA